VVVALASSRRSSSKTLPDDHLERFHAMEHPMIPPPIIRKSGFDFKKFMTLFHLTWNLPLIHYSHIKQRTGKIHNSCKSEGFMLHIAFQLNSNLSRYFPYFSINLIIFEG